MRIFAVKIARAPRSHIVLQPEVAQRWPADDRHISSEEQHIGQTCALHPVSRQKCIRRGLEREAMEFAVELAWASKAYSL